MKRNYKKSVKNLNRERERVRYRFGVGFKTHWRTFE